MRRHSFAAVLIAVALTASAGADTSRLEQAIASQREEVAKRPGDPGAMNDLANLLMTVGASEEAEAVYREVLQADPTHVMARYNLAVLLHSIDRPKLARRELKRVLEQAPTHAWAHYQLGVLQQELGRERAAVRHYGRAFFLEPRLTEPAFNPHVVVNRHKTRAMLLAHAEAKEAYTGPQTYADADAVATLLVGPAGPEVEPGDAGEPQPATAEGGQEEAEAEPQGETEDEGEDEQEEDGASVLP